MRRVEGAEGLPAVRRLVVAHIQHIDHIFVLGVGIGGYTVGEEVVIVGVPAAPQWRSEKGIELMGPRHFGFDFDYVPIEELQKGRGP